MRAKWKDKPLDQIQPSKRQRDIAMLQQQIKVLEHEKDQLLHGAQYFRDRLDTISKRLEERDEEVLLFRKLLQTEVMVPTKEGFKLLTGDELREYCQGLRSKPLAMKDITNHALEIMTKMWDEANQQLHKTYVNARSKSQKANQENP